MFCKEGVQRIHEAIVDRRSQMDIDHGGIKRFVTEKRLNNRKIDTLFVKMRSEGMTEAVRSKAFRPAE